MQAFSGVQITGKSKSKAKSNGQSSEPKPPKQQSKVDLPEEEVEAPGLPELPQLQPDQIIDDGSPTILILGVQDLLFHCYVSFFAGLFTKATIILASHSLEAHNPGMKMLDKHRVRAEVFWIAYDLRDKPRATGVAKWVEKKFGKLDILLINMFKTESCFTVTNGEVGLKAVFNKANIAQLDTVSAACEALTPLLRLGSFPCVIIAHPERVCNREHPDLEFEPERRLFEDIEIGALRNFTLRLQIEDLRNSKEATGRIKYCAASLGRVWQTDVDCWEIQDPVLGEALLAHLMALKPGVVRDGGSVAFDKSDRMAYLPW